MPILNNKLIFFRFNSQKILLCLGLLTLLTLSLVKIPTTFFTNGDWNHGFDHPLQGWDHLLTMIAVGIWAAQLRGQAIWMLPVTFVSVMSLGGLTGAASFSVPNAEIMILLSGLIFSVFVVRKVQFTTRINILIVAFFAFFSWLCAWPRNIGFSELNVLHTGICICHIAIALHRYSNSTLGGA